MNPENLTDAHIERVIEEYRAHRAKFEEAERLGKRPPRAVREQGATVTAAAARVGVSQAILERRLQRSARPHGSRWNQDIVDPVIAIIQADPARWGKRRVTEALAARGIVVSERRVRDVLRVAKDRLARAHRSQVQQAWVESNASHSALAAALALDGTRRKLADILPPSIAAPDAIARIMQASAARRWRFQAKKLTPELREFADAYLLAVRADPATYQKYWPLGDCWTNQDAARVAAIEHLVKRYWWNGPRLPNLAL
jgi:hypothetical protein